MPTRILSNPMFLLLVALGCDRSERAEIERRGVVQSEVGGAVDPRAAPPPDARVLVDAAGDASGGASCPAAPTGCCARHHFADAPPDGCPPQGCNGQGIRSFSAGECPPDACGVNGTWLGDGVPFRTLNLDGHVNDQQVKIMKFEVTGVPYPPPAGPILPIGTKLVANVEHHGDELTGQVVRSDGSLGPVLRGKSLIHTTLALRRFNFQMAGYDPATMEPITDYALEITDVITDGRFFVECNDPARCDDRPVTFYKFTATTGDGCAVDLCRPGLVADDSLNRGLAGMAVVFQGDQYDPRTLEVSDAPPRDFNIACIGTTVSKLHLLRHTYASQSPLTPEALQPSLHDRQTLLRLFTADYCGTEHFFTHNGMKLRIDLGAPVNTIYSVTKNSGFQSEEGETVEAMWGPDGARCLDAPRLGSELLPEVAGACGARFCAPGTPCPSSPPPCPLPDHARYVSRIPASP